MIELNGGLASDLPDATFDLDGTVFKMTVLEAYTEWLCQQGIFEPLPADIKAAKQVWKHNNTESHYSNHLGKLVRFFIEQVPGKSVLQLSEAARIVANQQRHRRWNITTDIIHTLRPTHNVIAISHMPEWLMEPFASDLGFVALIGSTYVAHEGLYTDEAYSIDKATEYTKMRSGGTTHLDIHMGDTVGDGSLFSVAARPILFNPSWTLHSQYQGKRPTTITSHKDVVMVMNQKDEGGHATATVWGPPFDVAAILKEVQTR